MSFLQYMRAGTTALKAHQAKLDAIGNNIANVSTNGFKRSRVDFMETYVEEMRAAIETGGGSTIGPYEEGYGVAQAYVSIDAKDGDYTETGNPLDLAIQGDGYFVMKKEDSLLYTRDGNMDINKNFDLIQEANGAFTMGWTATFDNQGNTDVNTTSPLQKINFKNLQNMPFKVTDEVIIGSNLNKEADSRKIITSDTFQAVDDLYKNRQKFSSSWNQQGANTWNFNFFQNDTQILKAKLDVDDLGNIRNWEILEGENLDIELNSKGFLHHITWNYNTTDSEGNTYLQPVTIAMPDETIIRGDDASIEHLLYMAKPGSKEFKNNEPVTFTSKFYQGETHSTLTKVVDDKGISHHLGIIFEKVDDTANRWQYRTYLSQDDPLIQAHLKDPKSGVENPNRPSQIEVETANSAAFGNSRVGYLDFDEIGVFDSLNSIVPTLNSRWPSFEEKMIKTVTLTDQGGKSADFELRVQPEGYEYKYSLMLPKTSPILQELALENENINNPQSLTDDEQTYLNDLLFSGTNKGILSYLRDGKFDPVQSVVPVILTEEALNPMEFEVNELIFKDVPASFPEVQNLLSGKISLNMDMELVTGFGGEFSTAVRSQNGFESGELIKTTITSNGDGLLQGWYTNGEVRDIGQIAMAVFDNAAGLVKSGNNIFKAGVNSGIDETSIGRPNERTRGLLRPKTLELSNVNLIDEFTSLITTQRVFQANSKILTTSDAMLQIGLGIKR